MSAPRRRVVVTGLGLVSPLGQDVQTVFAALMDGRSAIGLHAVGEAPHTTTIASGICAGIEPTRAGVGRLATMDRVSRLGVQAADAAWSDAALQGLATSRRERVAVLVGTATGGSQSTERGYRDLFVRLRPRVSPLTVVQSMNHATAAHIAHAHALGGSCCTYSMACASGAMALADGARRIRAGECEIALCGGAEAALPYGVIKAWLSMQVLARAVDEDAARQACRPFAEGRAGLVPAEGAAMLVLEELAHARARGARIYAELAGSGSSCDHGHITAPLAAGQLRALREALRQAEANPDEVAYVNAHGTATPEGDPVEIDALRQFFGPAAARLAVSATKSMHGHLMGAAGAIEALITVLAVHKGMIPPTAHRDPIDPACTGVDHVLGEGREVGRLPLALSNSFAFGGSNVVLAFRAPG